MGWRGTSMGYPCGTRRRSTSRIFSVTTQSSTKTRMSVIEGPRVRISTKYQTIHRGRCPWGSMVTTTNMSMDTKMMTTTAHRNDVPYNDDPRSGSSTACRPALEAEPTGREARPVRTRRLSGSPTRSVCFWRTCAI